MDNKNINITLQKANDKKHELTISFRDILGGLKKYFLTWVLAVVISGVLTLVGTALFAGDEYKTVTSLVSFTYKGIESGKDPAGRSFDVNTLKSPTVIEAALTKLDRPLEELENIRKNISIEGIIPSDAIDRITTYKSVYEAASTNGLSAAQAMLDVTYYPTQYKVTFNYADTDYKSSEAIEVINTVLESYRDYFFEEYGYNKALGSAVTAIDYNDYDYSEALDVFSSTISSLRSYVSQLANDDSTRFRSVETGYTFSDLSEALKTIQNIDLDMISSYISINNITKDKDASINYYQYRIESLTRSKLIAEEKLASIKESFDSYEKDTVMVFSDRMETSANQSSEQYDALIKQKISTQEDVSTAAQQIDYCNTRIKALQSKPTGSDQQKENVEAKLAAVNEKINNLLDKVNVTAEEYYETVSFENAYNILVPATNSATGFIMNLISSALKPAFIIEALIFVIYICTAVVTAYSKKNSMIEEKDADDSDDESEDNKKEDAEDKKEDISEKKEESEPKQNTNKNNKTKKK